MTRSYTFAALSWQSAQTELRRIRTQVFMNEQKVTAEDEWDGLDDQAIHLLARTTNGEAIGCARIIKERLQDKNWFHIGRVAVLKERRGEGIGLSLMHYALTWCTSTDSSAGIYLHAQVSSAGFYQKLGFIAQGTEFIDAGIVHINMLYAKEGGCEHNP